MIFRKRYEHSEWMKGFLWAEKKLPPHKSAEMFVEHVDGMQSYDILWRDKKTETPWVAGEGYNVSLDFGQGVIDYLEHRQLLQ